MHDDGQLFYYINPKIATLALAIIQRISTMMWYALALTATCILIKSFICSPFFASPPAFLFYVNLLYIILRLAAQNLLAVSVSIMIARTSCMPLPVSLVVLAVLHAVFRIRHVR